MATLDETFIGRTLTDEEAQFVQWHDPYAEYIIKIRVSSNLTAVYAVEQNKFGKWVIRFRINS